MLQGHVVRLEKLVGEMGEEITELNKTISSMGKEIVDLKEQIVAQEDITDLVAENKTLREEVSRLQLELLASPPARNQERFAEDDGDSVDSSLGSLNQKFLGTKVENL